jgi:ubiquinone/menaquinone biosynthesis C-methylase UbiE
MNNTKVKHNKRVWERFWDDKKEIDQVYSNETRILDQLKEVIDLRERWVVEIGAGSGRDGLKLADMGAFVVLLDYANASLKIIQALIKDSEKPIYLVQADAFNLPFRSASVDVVYHQGLLEHFTNPEDILRENYRILKKSGFALADVPQRFHLYTPVKHILIKLNKWFAGWETEFTINQLEKLFLTTGFTVHKEYGDWMHPSFVYKSMREVFKLGRIMLPKYPKPSPVIHRFRTKFAKWFRRYRLVFYTYMDIGVIGRK